MIRVREVISRARAYLDGEGQVSHWTAENMRDFCDAAEAYFRSHVALANIDMIRQREVTFTYPANADFIDLVAREDLKTHVIERIRRCFDVQDDPDAPVAIEEISWAHIEDYDRFGTTNRGRWTGGGLAFAWSGRDFALRPRPSGTRQVRIRFVPKRTVITNEQQTLEALPDDFLDLYAVKVAIFAMTKADESHAQLDLRYAEWMDLLERHIRQRSEETEDYMDYIDDPAYDPRD